MPNNGRFVAMPMFLQLQKEKLKYLDALIYITIRSFNNSDTNECYPAYETIAERSGMGRTFVTQSIKRLENAGYLKVKRSKVKHVCNSYSLEKKLPYFECIPYEIFDCDLTPNQKAMLICLRPLFVEGFLQCSMSIEKMAELIGVSYRTVHAQLTGLITKGYIDRKFIIHKNSDKAHQRFFFSDKIDWVFDYTPKKDIVQQSAQNLKIKLKIA
ncbi:helix-turn-helix domain-containing protein [Mucilaginibacter sp. JRF]|uniref:helix-turn-helix domain-containing protein n=1 Tax=Mucilaginibacter sp. JRF TaxID=2780088 RepID=UPI0018803353|nr:helix-turn-helix domain-containing protein [Mucilaginibacter sp. JRF]MBE9584014.1 helix-turn-helix domain-containing protein [Mucilaginibacter sp. JRF]